MPLSLEKKIKLLSMIDVFEALSEEDLERLSRLTRDAAYERGEDLPEPRKAARNSTCSRRDASSCT